MKPQVEIIVPVYNERQYLQRCVESLLSQSYDKYRILLVDDGSDDGSGDLCDWFAENHNNIEVIHKENGGLSSARNCGVRKSTAEWVAFVDADDYVSPYMIEDLVVGIKTYGADVSVVGLAAVGTESRKIKKRNEQNRRAIIMDTEDAMDDMCYMKHFGVSACGKLFKKELALRFPYPEGMLYEDLATTYKIIGDCTRVCYIDEVDYYYVQNSKEGITRGTYTPSHENAIRAAVEMRAFLKERHPAVERAGTFQIAYSHYNITKTLCGFSKSERQKYKHIKNEMRRFLIGEGVLADVNIKPRHKIQMLLASSGYLPMVIGWKLYYCLIKIRIIGK